jgi:predicted GH43/DUF377 family glycosyl hydrolase
MLITRYIHNPILTKEDVPYPVATVHNAGIVKFKGIYIMIFRSHKLNGRSILGKAESMDGYHFVVNKEPFMIPSTEAYFKEYEEYGIEDPRIVEIDGEFIITYSAYSKNGVRIGLAKTTDPIKTPRGWLSVYHGVFPTMDGSVYRLGVALHSLKDPSVILGVGDEWILQPEEIYEVTGYVHNVVFTCGAVPEPDGTVKIYWGGADTVMCMGTAIINELVDHCLVNSRNPLPS